MSLAGPWAFRIDPEKTGERQKWQSASLPDQVNLPGTMDENRKGPLNTKKPDFEILYRLYQYYGAAWYQREVEIPENWRGKHISLFLERCHWETSLWVDDQSIGMRDSLSTPHVYDLSQSLSPGKHRITLRVDNSFKYDVGGWAHSASDQTQTRWNGVIGRMELQATDPVWIQDVQAYPDVDNQSARLKVTVGSMLPANVACSIKAGVESQVANSGIKSVEARFAVNAGLQTVDIELPLPKNTALWDEFSPALHDITLSLSGIDAGRRFGDRKVLTVGWRKLGMSLSKQFSLNDRTLYLRGTLECCIFPKTGYPPTDLASWSRIIAICQSYGLNHMRFHSWCPPEAAFEAADRLGFLLQVEAPCWVGNWGKIKERDEWVRGEIRRILDTYGNHPSFILMSMGNEPGGDYSVIHDYVKMAQSHDARHKYTAGTGWGAGAADDFIVTQEGRGVRGPGTSHDIQSLFAKKTRPVISHEIGQWAVYPNFDEMKKYDGILRAKNFEIVQDDLKAKGMLALAPQFVRSSGLFMAQLYKEEIELLLRTRGHGGFQLLDLHDFPGQGTSLIGILDPFWDSKGFISPEEWRRFCSPTVPLLRLNKRTFTANEALSAQVDIAHFGARDLRKAEPIWSIADDAGRVIANGAFPLQTIPTGQLTALGLIETSLSESSATRRLTVSVGVKNSAVLNAWRIWVYPAEVQTNIPPGILFAREWNDAARQALADGGKVLLSPDRFSLAQSIQGSFKPVFWNPVMFKGGPNTMGILCDPRHPALALFPTDMQTDWQWFDLLENSRSVVLDGLPADFTPIVRVVDNYVRNRKLGNLFEARIGKGRLIVSSIDLAGKLDRRPANRQMLHSLLAYMESDAFKPSSELTIEQIGSLFRSSEQGVLVRNGAKVVRVDSEDAESQNTADKAIDGEPNTIWHTEWVKAKPGFPHEIVIDMQKTMALSGFRMLPRQDMANGWISRYEFYVGQDGKTWGAPAASGAFDQDDQEKVVKFPAIQTGRFIKLVALEGVNGNPFAAVAELDVTPAKP
jgi:hypothetical protein